MSEYDLAKAELLDTTPFAVVLERLKQTRDPMLATWFERAWIQAPDLGYIHTWPNWMRFCDLCSEREVLEV